MEHVFHPGAEMEAAGVGTGDGLLSIDAMAVAPEPGSWALMILGFGGVGVSLRRRREFVTGSASPAEEPLQTPRYFSSQSMSARNLS